MNLDLADGQRAWLGEVARLAADDLAPGAIGRAAAGDIPADCIAALVPLGLLGVRAPTAVGGAGRTTLEYAMALGLVAGADASIAVTMAVTNMVGEVIARFGTPAQVDRYGPALVRAQMFGGAFALSEPGAGSDAAALSTRATPVPGGYRIDGQKMWITTGDRAGVMVVWARTGGSGPKGISCFLVEGGTSGVTAGRPERKMGLSASHTVALSFDGVVVPEEALLGTLGQGFQIAMMALDGGRIGISGQALGIAEAGLRDVVGTAGQAWDQGARFKIADVQTELCAGWLLTQRAACLKDLGQPFSREAAMAKVFSTECANRSLQALVAVAGPDALGAEAALGRRLRDCRVTEIYEGTSEIQRLVIARQELR